MPSPNTPTPEAGGLPSKALRPPSRAVDHRQNPHAVIEDAIDQDKGRASNDKLAPSLHSPRSAEMRVIGKLFRGVLDRRSITRRPPSGFHARCTDEFLRDRFSATRRQMISIRCYWYKSNRRPLRAVSVAPRRRGPRAARGAASVALLTGGRRRWAVWLWQWLTYDRNRRYVTSYDRRTTVRLPEELLGRARRKAAAERRPSPLLSKMDCSWS